MGIEIACYYCVWYRIQVVKLQREGRLSGGDGRYINIYDVQLLFV